MIQLTLSPGLWMVIIILACGINFLFGEIKLFVLPRVLIATLCKFLIPIFDKGEKRVMGLVLWLTVNVIVLGILITTEHYVYGLSSYLAVILDVYLLVAVIGENKLYRKVRKYMMLYSKEEYDELEERIERNSEVNLNLSSKYGMTR